MEGEDARASYNAGYQYGLWVVKNDPESDHIVDTEKMLRGTVSMPPEDYRWLREQGVEPCSREYWRGFNAALVEARHEI